MATNTVSSTIVLELLSNDNYANWSAWMKNYLLGQDLWDVVINEPPKVIRKAWTKNNAAALHAILISCELDILPRIREITSAKKVWDELARMYGPDNSSSITGDSSSNIPPRDLLQYDPLFVAIANGKWDAANEFLSLYEDAKSAIISTDGATALHLAVQSGHTEIVEKLVDLMSAVELEKTDNFGWTALAYATIQQNTGMVDYMLRKNTNLLCIPDSLDSIPLVTALQSGNRKWARHLYSVYPPHQKIRDTDASTALTHFIYQNNFDLALDLHHRCPASATVQNSYGSTALMALATNHSAFLSGNQLVFWKRWIYACISISSATSTDGIQINIHSPSERQSDQGITDEIQTNIDSPRERQNDQGITGLVLRDLLLQIPSKLLPLYGIKRNLLELKKLHQQPLQLLSEMCSQVKQMNGDSVNEVLFQVIKGGISEFIDKILEVDHHLLYTTDTMGRNILFYAVLYCQEKIFHLILQKTKEFDPENLIKNARDKSSNTILHMAAMLESSTKSDRLKGKVLKIQSELEWFKKVERECLPWIKEIRNYTNMTAKELFTHNHKDMMKEGEKWMKGIANASTVVGTLIITIIFSAAFIVPGGNDQNTGFPLFSHKKLYMVFIICDALSLFYSSNSVLIFLQILTLGHREEDFLQVVRGKMILGYYTLFISIATIMITFCAARFIMLPQKLGILILVIIVALGPILFFHSLLLRLERALGRDKPFPMVIYSLDPFDSL